MPYCYIVLTRGRRGGTGYPFPHETAKIISVHLLSEKTGNNFKSLSVSWPTGCRFTAKMEKRAAKEVAGLQTTLSMWSLLGCQRLDPIQICQIHILALNLQAPVAYIIMFASLLRLCPPSSVFPSELTTKILFTFLISSALIQTTFDNSDTLPSSSLWYVFSASWHLIKFGVKYSPHYAVLILNTWAPLHTRGSNLISKVQSVKMSIKRQELLQQMRNYYFNKVSTPWCSMH